MLKLYFDCCVPIQYARSFTGRGFDVAFAKEKIPDPQVAIDCVEGNGVLVTANAKDFLNIYSQFPQNPGLAITPNLGRGYRMNHAVDTMDRFAEFLSIRKPDLQNKLIVVGRHKDPDIFQYTARGVQGPDIKDLCDPGLIRRNSQQGAYLTALRSLQAEKSK